MRIHVSFDLYLPEGTAAEHITEWLNARLVARAPLASVKNTMAGKPLEVQNLDWEER